MSRPVLVGVGAASGEHGPKVMAALRRLLVDASRLADGDVVAWSGPEDGSGSGHLELANGLDVSLVDRMPGIQMALCLMAGGEDDRTIGTIIDKRLDAALLNHLDPVQALETVRSLVAGWSDEAAAAVDIVRPLTAGPAHDRYVAAIAPFQTASDAAASDLVACAMACGGANEWGGAPAVTIDHPTVRSGYATTIETAPDERWALDPRTTAALSTRIAPALRISMRSIDPGPPEALYEPWSTVRWHGDPVPTIETMRRVAEIGVDWAPTLERLEEEA